MKLLAFAASTSAKSINKQLLAYSIQLLENGLVDDIEVETIDLNDFEMPIFNVDREAANGIPQQAKDFFAKIGAADALLISFAEHNGNYTAAYKNIFDWASRIEVRVYQDKPVVMLATSPGRAGASNVLDLAVTSGQFYGYEVKSSLSIPSFGHNFDTDAGSLTNSELDEELRTALAALDLSGGSDLET